MSDSNSGQTTSSPASGSATSDAGLLRVLGPGMAIAMVVGNTIGSGIFFKPATIALAAGDFPLIISCWIVGGLICLCGALSLAELAAMLPRAGGLFVYLRAAYGNLIAFLFGWCEFFFGTPASIGALSVVVVGSLAGMGQASLDEFETVIAALLLIAFFGGVNIAGVIWGGRMQATTTLIKTSGLIVLASLPWTMGLFGAGEVDVSNFSTVFEPESPNLVKRVVAVMLAVLWAYNGWEAVTPVAEEVRDPGRNVPRALIIGLGILIAVYCAANLAFHSVLNMSDLAALGEQKSNAAVALVEKQFESAGKDWVLFGRRVISMVLVVSAIGALSGNLMHSPRVAFALGRARLFFPVLGETHARLRTPAVAISVQSVMAMLIVIAAAVGKAHIAVLEKKSLFDILTDYIVFSASCFLLLAVLAVFILRVRHPDWERPYRTWGYPVVPALYIVFYVTFLGLVFSSSPVESTAGIGLLLLGVPAFAAHNGVARMWTRD